MNLLFFIVSCLLSYLLCAVIIIFLLFLSLIFSYKVLHWENSQLKDFISSHYGKKVYTFIFIISAIASCLTFFISQFLYSTIEFHSPLKGSLATTGVVLIILFLKSLHLKPSLERLSKRHKTSS